MSSLVEIALVNAVLAALLAGVAYAAGRLADRPALTHALWVLVLLKLVTPPLVPVPVAWGLHLDWLAVAEPPVPATDAVVRRAAPKTDGRAAGPAAAPRLGVREERVDAASAPAIAPLFEFVGDRRFWFLAALAAWLAGTCVWTARQLSRIVRFNRLLRRTDLAPADVQAQNRALARALGLRRFPLVRLVPGTFSPMLWAFGARAQLLFPADLLARLDEPSRGTLLAHELAHYRRRDHWVHLLQLVVTGLYWWHPAVWWARRGIEISEEECCDAWVVHEFPETPRRYAEALLETVDFLAGAKPFVAPTASGLGDVPLLRQRLIRIMHGAAPRTLSLAGRCSVLALAAALPLRPVEAISPLGPAPSPGQTAELPNESPAPRRPADRRPRRAARPRVARNRPAAPAAPRDREERVWASAVSPDGRWTITAGRGRDMVLSGAEDEVEFDLSDFGITTVAFSAEGGAFVSGSGDGTVRLWDAATGRPLAVLGTHDDAVKAVAFAPDGETAASGSRDGVVKTWRIRDLMQADEFPQERAAVGSLAFSPDSRRLAMSVGHWMSLRPGTVRVWDLSTRELTLEFEAPSPVGAVVFHPDGEMLVVGEWSGRLAWRDLRTGVELAESTVDKDRMSSAAFSPDGGLPTDLPPVVTDPILVSPPGSTPFGFETTVAPSTAEPEPHYVRPADGVFLNQPLPEPPLGPAGF